jgi:hypothetical protein
MFREHVTLANRTVNASRQLALANKASTAPAGQHRCPQENSTAYLVDNAAQTPRYLAKVVACMAGQIHRLRETADTFWPHVDRDGETEFSFRARGNGITFTFSEKEWTALQKLFRRAWQMPEVRLAWNALTREYGEL